MNINKYKMVLLAIVLAFLYSCSSSKDELCSDTGISCQVGGTVKACCTNNSCRYELNGVSYPCNGTDCGAAASEVVNVCKGRAKALSSDALSVEELLLLEKSDNLLLEKEIDDLSRNK